MTAATPARLPEDMEAAVAVSLRHVDPRSVDLAQALGGKARCLGKPAGTPEA